MASFSRTLAVDLGASAVRLAEVGPDSKGRPTVLALSEEEISFDPVMTSDLFEVYAHALRNAVGRLGSKTRHCHLCLGGPAVFSRILKIPAVNAEKVESVLGFEAQQTVPAIEQALWDYQLLPSIQSGEIEALILAIKKDTVQEMAAASAAAGLKPISVTLTPAALINAFFFNYPEASGCNLILEIGARATTILILEDSRLFVRVVPLGGMTISQAVATDLQESFAGAEVLKKAKGFIHPGGAYEDPVDPITARISKLARGVLTRLHAEVERSVTFFRSQQGGGKPTKVWLTGGGAILGHMDLFFQDKLRTPVHYLQPFRRFGLTTPGQLQSFTQQFPFWATAMGTICHALPQAPLRIDVLGAMNRSLVPKSLDLPAKVVGATCLASLLFLPGVHGLWQAAKSEQRLAAETQRVEQASQVLEKLEEENKNLEKLLQRIESSLRLEDERLRWPKLIGELRKKMPARLWVTSVKVLPPTETAGSSVKTPSPPAPPIIEITGMFETQSKEADAEAVGKFQKALEEGGIVKNITILEREAPQYVEGKTDQVALKFRLKADWPIAIPEKQVGGGNR